MAGIVRWDPFRELVDMRGTMDRLFYRPWRLVNVDAGQGFFAVDLYETDDEVVVTASLPGVKPDDLQISVTGDTLTVKGETKEDREEKQPSYYRKERRYGTFRRTLTLPVEVDADNAEATFEDGVLNLRLPKAPELRSKTIEVKSGGVVEAATS